MTTLSQKLKVVLIAFSFATASFLQAQQEAMQPLYDSNLDISPRLQWNANYGYCGEVSFISAGLYFGQYCSQFTARELASPRVRQSLETSQLLLGVNDLKAATAMRLTATNWQATRRSTTKDFMLWVKTNVLAGYPVVIGVFTNEYRFYRNSNPNAGDGEYDHIVPVLGIGSDEAPLNQNPKAYDGDDIITFSDNGLWNRSGTPTYTFSYHFADFPKTRAEANVRTGAIYSVKNGTNYGIVFTGVADSGRHTIPVRLTTSFNYEKPSMANGASTAPSPMPLTLTVTVSIPDQKLAYNLYMYDNFANVPTARFNAPANVRKSVRTWKIPSNSGPTYTFDLPIMSNQTVVFRAVRSTAP